MCPLYKKKDCHEIPNYRPITVLNAEYKILTTAIMNKLSDVAPNLIHKSQTAFIKGHSIFDQIDQAKRLIDLCNIKNQNGVIILLDQEKVYDKIKHDYLWKVLEATNLPTNLIKTIKSLYKFAETRVILNGNISKNFHVTRGVHQGNPLSCLLFNFAIEPLSKMIRTTNNLKGLKITTPTETHKAILSLFMDDAAVFLAEDNHPESLFEILHKWCQASGTRFNNNKTIIIPVSSEAYRNSVLDLRKLSQTSNHTFENTIHILKDGESTRYLGVHIRNQITNDKPWPKIINEIEHSLNHWSKAYPGLKGRKHIIQMIIGDKTQFITATQGMPPKYEEYLMKRICSFLWDTDSPPPVTMATMSNPHCEGGLKVLNLKARNEAIRIMKLKKLANHSASCPLASDAALEIIQACTILTPNGPTMTDIFLQSFFKHKCFTNKQLPQDLKAILNSGAKHNLILNAPSFCIKHKLNLPAWFHPRKETNAKKKP